MKARWSLKLEHPARVVGEAPVRLLSATARRARAVAALGGFAIAAYLVTRGTSAPDDASPSARAPAAADPDHAAAAPPATSLSTAQPAASVAQKPSLKATPSKLPATQKTAVKKPAPATSGGVAGGLGLSTREP